MSNPRRQAAGILHRILRQQGSLASLQDSSQNPDSALIQELCYGVCRHFHELSALLAELMDKPLRQKDQDIQCLLLLGLYQLLYLRIPDHAAINETVNAAKKPWARGLINAVLRESRRRYPDYSASSLASLSLRYSHPQWLVNTLQQDWPEHTEQILAANNTRAPMTLRLNTRKLGRTDYLKQLRARNIEAEAGSLTETSIILGRPEPVSQLPGFAEGLISVQDEASQLCRELLAPEPGMKVLDACAAPGGKTCALLEAGPDLRLCAVDNDSSRLERVRENLERLKLTAQLKCADAGNLQKWWDGEPFDRILLDVPCSATGVIRRHPDIKMLRTPAQVQDLKARQAGLLEAVWSTLAPGGILLYSTCSLLLDENERQIESFINKFKDAQSTELMLEQGVSTGKGHQLLPGQGNCDGFYYALLTKC